MIEVEMINGLAAFKPRGMSDEQEREWRRKMSMANGLVNEIAGLNPELKSGMVARAGCRYSYKGIILENNTDHLVTDGELAFIEKELSLPRGEKQ